MGFGEETRTSEANGLEERKRTFGTTRFNTLQRFSMAKWIKV